VPVYYYRKRSAPARPTLDHLSKPPPPPKQTFLRLAVFWGGGMFVSMTLVPTVRKANATGEWDWIALAVGAIVWTIGGIAFGWIMSRFLTKQRTNAERTPTGS
jgi:hypothetical protein